MAGDTFDAGTVYAESRLGRDQIQRDIRDIRNDLRKFAKESFQLKVTIDRESFKQDVNALRRDFEKATKGFTIVPTLDEDSFDRQMRAMVAKWRKEQLTLSAKLNDAEFDAEMKRLAARMKSLGGIRVPVSIDEGTLEAELARLSRQLAQAGKPIDIPVKLATEQAHAQSDALHATVERPAVVAVDANTRPAMTKFAALRAWIRKQTVDFIVNIKVKDIRKAISFLGQMSYRLSAVGRGFDAAGKFADRNLMKIVKGLQSAILASTMMFLQFARFGGAALGAAGLASEVLGLAGALSQVAYAGLALPGVIFAMIGGITALKMGMGGVGEALKNAFDPKNAEKFNEAMKKLHPEAQKFVRAIQGMNKAWTAMKKEVQGALFKDLAGDVKQLAQIYLPMLSDQLPKIASAFNIGARSITGFMMTQRAQADVNIILGETANLWYDIMRAITPVLSILLDLAAVALPLITEMTRSLGDYTGGWAQAIHEMRQSGQLADMLQRGFTAVAMVLGLVQNVMSILTSVSKAASRAGFGVFLNYTMAAGALSRFLKSAEGMRLLDSIFQTIAQAMAIVQPFLAAVGNMLVQYVLPAVQQTLPIVAQAFAALAPAMGPLGQIIAALLPVVAQLAVAFAQQLAGAIITLAPYILGFLKMLQQNPAAAAALVAALGVLGFAFTHLGTILMLIGKIMVFRQLQAALLALGAPGAAVNGVLSRMLGWMGSLGRVMGMILGPVGLLIGGLIAMYMNSASFRDAINNLLGAIMGLLGSALQPFMQIMGVLAPIVGEIARLLGDGLAPIINIIAEGLKFLNPVITALTYAWIAWTVATWALNSALLANPITWIILAIVALIAAVVLLVQNWDTVWNAIATAASWAWENVIKPVLDALGAAFTWLMTNVIQPVVDFFVAGWNLISGAISTAWDAVIWPVLQALGTALAYLGLAIVTILVTPFYLAWKAISAVVGWAVNEILLPLWYNYVVPALMYIGAVAMWLWNNAIVPAWNGIVAAVQIAWSIIQVIWSAFVAGLQLLGSWFMALWNAYVVPAWNGIKTAAQVAWNWLMANVFTPLMNYLRLVGAVFIALWNQYVVPAWNGIKAAAAAAWAFIQAYVFAPLQRGLDMVGRAFSMIAEGIRVAWDKIKEYARGPVKFVVDIVYNNGIRSVWNGIAGMFGMGQLPAVTMATGGIVSQNDTIKHNVRHLATGGVLGGYQPGRDSVLTMLSPGEGVLVPEAVKGLGVGFVSWANAFFAQGRVAGGANYPQGQGNRMSNFTRDQRPRKYATGGVVRDGVLGKVDPTVAGMLEIQKFAGGGIVDGIGAIAESMFGFITDVFSDPVGAVRKLFGAVLGDGANTPGQGSWTDALKNIPVKTVDAVITKVKEWVESIMSMGGGGNWAPVILQSLAMVGQPASTLGITQRRLMQESGGNPTIVNKWDSNWAKGTPSVGLMQVIGPTFAANAGPLRGVGPFLYGTSVNPLANIYSSMRYTMGRYGSLAAGYGKANGYRNGGVLRPGEMGFNETGQDEYVFNRNQLRTVINGGKLGTPASVSNSVIRNVGGDSKGSGNIETLVVQAPQGATAKETVDEAVFAWKHANNGAYGGSDR